jgi:hypothetical protein
MEQLADFPLPTLHTVSYGDEVERQDLRNDRASLAVAAGA